ncbi:MAG: RluA family pseudouridine synthase [bacterium]
MTQNETQTFVAGQDDAGKRLDLFLTERLGSISRSAVQRAVREGLVALNGRPPKSPHEALRTDDKIDVSTDLTDVDRGPASPQPRPEIRLEVVYEDDDLLVVNKPTGLLVHPTVRNEQETLVGALLAHYPPIAGVGESAERPGIVHRLDKDASGLMVVAKTGAAYAALKRDFQAHDIEKEYAVLVTGSPPDDDGTIDRPIGRSTSERRMAARSQPLEGDRPAVTHYRVDEHLPEAALLSVRTETGRTHQIRAHFKSLGCPVAGDKLYGPRRPRIHADRLFLHAKRLAFRHPRDGRRMEFSAPLPPELERMLERLRQKR